MSPSIHAARGFGLAALVVLALSGAAGAQNTAIIEGTVAD